MIKTYYYQTAQGEMWGFDVGDLDEAFVDLEDNCRAMVAGNIKMFRDPITEEKVIRCFGVIDGGVK